MQELTLNSNIAIQTPNTKEEMNSIDYFKNVVKEKKKT